MIAQGCEKRLTVTPTIPPLEQQESAMSCGITQAKGVG